VSGQGIAAKHGRNRARSGISTGSSARTMRRRKRVFHALGSDAKKDRSPTVFNLKVCTAKDDLKTRRGV